MIAPEESVDVSAADAQAIHTKGILDAYHSRNRTARAAKINAPATVRGLSAPKLVALFAPSSDAVCAEG